jgi:hypothetical protein
MLNKIELAKESPLPEGQSLPSFSFTLSMRHEAHRVKDA